MSLEDFYNGLASVIINDDEIKAWANTHFRKPLTVLDGNIEIERIDFKELPALILEPQPADLEIVTIGGKVMDEDANIGWAIVWNEKNRVNAMMQKLRLPTLIVKSIMANNTLNGLVSAAWVDSYEPDGGGTHPVHVMRGNVTADYKIRLT